MNLSITITIFSHTVCQNNFGNKIPEITASFSPFFCCHFQPHLENSAEKAAVQYFMFLCFFSRRDGLKEFVTQEFPQVTNVALVVIRRRTIVKMMTHSVNKGYENPPAGTVLDKMVTNK